MTHLTYLEADVVGLIQGVSELWPPRSSWPPVCSRSPI
jgi:hypothetical protein